MLEQHFVGQDAAVRLGERAKNIVLLWRQMDLAAVQAHTALHHIDLQRTFSDTRHIAIVQYPMAKGMLACSSGAENGLVT